MIDILSATGHRPEKLGGYNPRVYDKLLNLAMKHLQIIKPKLVISGMALGWDMAVAEASLLLGIPYDAYRPFPSQSSMWPRDSKVLHRNLCAGARNVVDCEDDPYEAWKMQYRNDCMRKDSNAILALYNGDPTGGTANAVRAAQKEGKEIINLWDEWITL